MRIWWSYSTSIKQYAFIQILRNWTSKVTRVGGGKMQQRYFDYNTVTFIFRCYIQLKNNYSCLSWPILLLAFARTKGPCWHFRSCYSFLREMIIGSVITSVVKNETGPGLTLYTNNCIHFECNFINIKEY
jgi:hypothetical protein